MWESGMSKTSNSIQTEHMEPPFVEALLIAVCGSVLSKHSLWYAIANMKPKGKIYATHSICK